MIGLRVIHGYTMIHYLIYRGWFSRKFGKKPLSVELIGTDKNSRVAGTRSAVRGSVRLEINRLVDLYVSRK